MARRVSWLVIAMVSTVVLSTVAHAASIVLPRPGQVGIGMQGQYGTLLKAGDLGEHFESGPGLAVRLRYRMRYERAIGLSFESHQMDSRVGAELVDSLSNPPARATQLSMIMTGFEVYQLFDTRSRTTKMLSVGAGLVQPSVKLETDETTYPDDGLFVSAGAGIERFFYRSFAFDLSARYYAIFQHGKTNHDVQAALGLIFYASY